MRCDKCGDSEAEVHLTQIESGELNTIHLCDACAEEEGVPEGATVGDAPLADFVAEAGKSASGSMLPAGSEACPYCGTSPEDFRRTGRLGCAQCWAHFEDQLEALIRRIHGSTQHVGKLYLGDASEAEDRRTRLDRLRRRLERAVEVEDFETAADLRDQIEELETVE
jgi:protein arginine kinase activator